MPYHPHLIMNTVPHCSGRRKKRVVIKSSRQGSRSNHISIKCLTLPSKELLMEKSGDFGAFLAAPVYHNNGELGHLVSYSQETVFSCQNGNGTALAVSDNEWSRLAMTNI